MTEETKKPRKEKPTRKRRLYLGLMTYQGGLVLIKLTMTKGAAQAWAKARAEKAEPWQKWRAEVRTFTRAERGSFYKEREDLRQAWGTLKEPKPGDDLPRGSMRSTDQESLAEPMTKKEIMADYFQGNQEALEFMDELDEIDRLTEQANEERKNDGQ